jgi:hypothetical protein
MAVCDRVLCALRARFWLHFWREHIIKMSKANPYLYSMQRSFISPARFRIFNRLYVTRWCCLLSIMLSTIRSNLFVRRY